MKKKKTITELMNPQLTEIEELKKRIEELEKRPVYYPPIIINPPYSPPFPQGQPVHYHNGTPCYINPCVWC